MKKKILSISPFLIMFCIVIGSVVTSCTTQNSSLNEVVEEPSSINIPVLEDGRIFTTEVYSRINKVIVFNSDDKSQKEELEKKIWDYNQITTELVITSGLPFNKPVIHLEGYVLKPTRFVINNSSTNFEPFIAINGRLAVQGYDYYWDKENVSITMKNNFSKDDLYYIYYKLNDGSSASIGNWHYYDDINNRDILSYQFSQHVENQIVKYGDLTEIYYILDENYTKGSKPSVIKKVYDKNKKEALNNSLGINKPRFKTSDKDLSKEVGYNITLPKKIKSHKIEYYNTFIYEYLFDEEKYLSTNRIYQINNKTRFLVILNQLNSKSYINSLDKDTIDKFTIENNSINLGLEVNRIIYWDLSYDNGTPEAVKNIIYSWEDNFAKIEVKALENSQDIIEDFISEIIQFRMDL